MYTISGKVSTHTAGIFILFTKLLPICNPFGHFPIELTKVWAYNGIQLNKLRRDALYGLFTVLHIRPAFMVLVLCAVLHSEKGRAHARKPYRQMRGQLSLGGLGGRGVLRRLWRTAPCTPGVLVLCAVHSGRRPFGDKLRAGDAAVRRGTRRLFGWLSSGPGAWPP